MANLGDAKATPAQTVGGRALWKQWALVDVGAAGAPTIATGNQSGDISISRSAAGSYDVVCKAMVGGPLPTIKLKSAAKTVVTWVLTAYNLPAGTFSFKTLAGVNAAADTDPANGDAIGIEIEGLPVAAG